MKEPSLLNAAAIIPETLTPPQPAKKEKPFVTEVVLEEGLPGSELSSKDPAYLKGQVEFTEQGPAFK